MTGITQTFRERFTSAFHASDFKSYRQLSLAAKCSEPVVQQIVSGKFDGSTSGPGIFTFHRLAQALNASMDSFLNGEAAPPQTDISAFNAKQGQDPASFDALMACHWRGGGRLEAFESLADHFDLYDQPNANAAGPTILQLGRQNLMAMRLETTDPRIAQREIDRLPPQSRRDILKFHRRVLDEGIVADNTFLDHQLHSKPVHVRASYSRLGLRVEQASKPPMVLTAYKPIPV